MTTTPKPKIGVRDRKLIDRFIALKRADRGISPNTERAYRQALEAFAQQTRKALVRTTRDDVRAWRQASTLQNSTLQARLSVLKGFFDWLLDESIIRVSPVPLMLAIQSEHHETYIPAPGEIIALRRHISRRAGPQRIERIAAIEILVGCGLRISELRQVRESDFDLEAGILRLDPRNHRLKRSHGRHTHVPPRTETAVRALLEIRRIRRTDPNLPLICLSERVIAYALSAVNPNLTPHALRRFWASAMYVHNLDGGINDLLWVKEHAGHSNVNTTTLYARGMTITDEQWQELFGYAEAMLLIGIDLAKESEQSAPADGGGIV